MKFVRFEFENKKLYGLVEADEIYEIEGSIYNEFQKKNEKHKINSVKLFPPTNPTKIVCIGQNYLEHIKEIGATPPKVPLFFLKPPSSLIGPSDDIIYPKMATRVDYEGELAIVIKKEMKNVDENDVAKYVLGYSCFNDVTERDLVGQDPYNLTIGKSFDTFSCLGPCVATDIDADNLEIKTYLNGNVMQHDNTKSCVFNVNKLLSYLSKCMTLCQGDIVTTGTPKGIAPMKLGDLVEVEIESIGKLSNKIKAEN